MTAPNVAYTAPLSNAQRLSIVQAIASYSGLTPASVANTVQGQGLNFNLEFDPTTGDPKALPAPFGKADIAGFDSILIADYQNIISHPPGQAGFGGSPNQTSTQLSAPSPLESVASFLSKLTNGDTWIRVAEFATGFLLLGIAAVEIAKNVGAGSAAAKGGGLVKTGVSVVNPLSSPNRKVRAVRSRQQYSEAARASTREAAQRSAHDALYNDAGRHSKVGRHAPKIDLNAPVL